MPWTGVRRNFCGEEKNVSTAPTDSYCDNAENSQRG